MDHDFDAEEPLTEDGFPQGLEYLVPAAPPDSFHPAVWPFTQDPEIPDVQQQRSTETSWELMDLGGLTEGLPPMDLMEDL